MGLFCDSTRVLSVAAFSANDGRSSGPSAQTCCIVTVNQCFDGFALNKQNVMLGGVIHLQAFPERQTCQQTIRWSSEQVGWSETLARVVLVFPIHFYGNQRETEGGELSQQAGEVTQSS